ncbi:glutamate synthase subunit beta [Rubrivirga sp.]|uniref:glutamate synthase subunit beta n=1 Tax=Rubrivirga sp. TaxID=1885344 RepID=UPI003C759442
MSNTFDFLDLPRQPIARRPVARRVEDDLAVELPILEGDAQTQARRCMDCGVPFCQAGCPLGNAIPDFNEAVQQERWRDAYDVLSATNNFPEFTGRICPAPCESACVLGLAADPVTIEQIEQAVAEKAFQAGWVKPSRAALTGKTVGVVGSGPAGLAAAAQLASVGHTVTVYERDDRPGGLLRYGVPDFKLSKDLLDRRLDVLRASGVRFECGVEVGTDGTWADLRARHDAVIIATGATRAHDLEVPGRELGGVVTAWDYLTPHAKQVAGGPPSSISAAGKRVVVIGGGDTASDCIGVAHRQGAASVVSFQITDRPPDRVPRGATWPFRSPALSTSSSHEEGGDRVWSVSAQEFCGDGHVSSVRTLDARVDTSGGGFRVETLEETDRMWGADLVVIAIGYAGPETEALTEQTGVTLDSRGWVSATDYATAADGVFVAGDAQRGASLVVWAISDGREAARAVDLTLEGETSLPTKGDGDLPRG